MPKLDQPFSGSPVTTDLVSVSLPSTSAELEKLQTEAGTDNADAQYLLGLLHEDGNDTLGIEEDEDCAIRWYYLAAVNGHRDAQFSLAYRMHSQLAFQWPPPAYFSSAEVIRWYKAAAEQGHGEAAYQLYLEFSANFESGDQAQAAHWRTIAASLGYDPDAQEHDEESAV